MTRADAEALGWVFDLDVGEAKKLLPSGSIVRLRCGVGEEALFSLLVNIAEREGVGFAEGYGGETPITPELIADPPTLDADLPEFEARVSGSTGPVDYRDLFVLVALVRRRFGRVEDLLQTARDAVSALNNWRTDVVMPALQNLGGRMSNVEDTGVSLAQRVTALEAQVATLEAANVALGARVTALEGKANRADVLQELPPAAPRGYLIYLDPTDTVHVGHGAGTPPTPV